MYRVFVKSVSLGQLLSLADSEYVDAIFAKNHVSLVNNSTELFGVLTMRMECSVKSDSNFSCRIPKKILSDLACDGYFDLTYSDDRVKISFHNEKGVTSCSVSFIRQNIFSETYTSKLELISDLSEAVSIDTESLLRISRIAKGAGSIINVNSGVAGVHLPYNARVYQKVNSELLFSITANSFSTLRRCNGKLFSIQNYVGTTNDDLIILATKARDTINNEFSIIEAEKSKFKCTVDFSAFAGFVNKVKPKIDYVTLDLEREMCFVEYGRVEYEIPVPVRNKQIVDNATWDKIPIPLDVFKIVFSNLVNKTVTLSKKRNFVRMDEDDLIILF